MLKESCDKRTARERAANFRCAYAPSKNPIFTPAS
jgi:hypothetical protein